MFEIQLDKEKCKGCGLCVYYCKPRTIFNTDEKVLKMTKKLNASGFPYPEAESRCCVGCLDCAVICREVAIEVVKK